MVVGDTRSATSMAWRRTPWRAPTRALLHAPPPKLGRIGPIHPVAGKKRWAGTTHSGSGVHRKPKKRGSKDLRETHTSPWEVSTFGFDNFGPIEPPGTFPVIDNFPERGELAACPPTHPGHPTPRRGALGLKKGPAPHGGGANDPDAEHQRA